MAKKVSLKKLIKYADRFMGNGSKSCTASDFLDHFDRLEAPARDVFRTDQVTQMLNSTKSDDEKAKFVVPCFFQLVEFYVKGVIGADQGRKRVIQRRFNVSVPRARVSQIAPTLRERSER